MSSNQQIEKGVLLLAEPFMEDPYFKRAAVLLCENHPQGTLGFILNKPTQVRLEDVLEDFPPFDAPVYYGGPVQADRLHYIHNLGDLLEDSLPVSDGVWWGGDFDSLKFLIQSELVRPEQIRFFVGYAGWSAGQLEDELSTGSWVPTEMDPNYAFKTAADKIWSLAMYNKGNAFEILADLPDELSSN
ncbi:MAG: YqgE/AlgH family protein [Chitinophagales bacterium]|jgi:putative transcriptional regulator